MNFDRVKRLLTKILKDNEFLLSIYNSYYKLLNKKEFLEEVEKRKMESIFEYEVLSKELPFYPDAPVKDSNFYGHYYWLKNYTNLEKFDFAIEHGLYLGSHVPIATHLKTTKAVVTFSKNREEHLRNAGVKKPIVKIGPYIHYADSLLSDKQFIEIKEKFGRILTVFPSHSIKGFNVNIDQDHLLDEIDRIKAEYSCDSVFVCAYYKDIRDNNFIEQYRQRGYNIVTAGHQYDLNFLSRLKSIIQLSDYTMSNTVGTHTGYCIYLNKPHYIFNQEIEYTDKEGKPSKEYRFDHEVEKLRKEMAIIIKAFDEFNSDITEDQKKIVDEYWGVSEIKGRDKLRLKLLG
ncbi:hypothetical protein [Gracilimonas sp. BCB1]|uniref:hypothetical protein n=1 Tax=Gracilimonas sp. BCB1 TaxID=3152362 RepID=UPI0032D99386